MVNSPIVMELIQGKQTQIRKLAFSAYSSLLTFNGEVYVWGTNGLSLPTLLKVQDKQSIE